MSEQSTDGTGCIRCDSDSTSGYPDVYCRDCVESVAWIFKKSRENDPGVLKRTAHLDTDRNGGPDNE